MNHKFTVLVLGIFLIGASGVFFSNEAAADYGGKKTCYRGERASLEDKFYHKAHFVLVHKETAGLSDEQIQAIKDLKHETKKTLIKQQADIDILVVDIESKLRAHPTLDLEGINQLIDQKYEIKKSKVKGLASAFSQLKGIVTEEQWDKLKAVWKKK